MTRAHKTTKKFSSVFSTCLRSPTHHGSRRALSFVKSVRNSWPLSPSWNRHLKRWKGYSRNVRRWSATSSTGQRRYSSRVGFTRGTNGIGSSGAGLWAKVKCTQYKHAVKFMASINVSCLFRLIKNSINFNYRGTKNQNCYYCRAIITSVCASWYSFQPLSASESFFGWWSIWGVHQGQSGASSLSWWRWWRWGFISYNLCKWRRRGGGGATSCSKTEKTANGIYLQLG